MAQMMPTNFPCPMAVSSHPETGLVIIGLGPLDMGKLVELLDYLGTEEARDTILEAASKAFMGNQSDVYGSVHLRGIEKTACGMDLWTTNELGQRVTTLASVGWPGHPDHPVTCPDCKAWIARNRT